MKIQKAIYDAKKTDDADDCTLFYNNDAYGTFERFHSANSHDPFTSFPADTNKHGFTVDTTR